VAGAAAVFGVLGFFGCGRWGFGGGAAGWSSANTGFGSVVVVAGVEKSAGFLITFTATVAGSYLGRL
jgi:hypothetical protein